MSDATYKCNVLNCGNGKCVHRLLDEKCPICGCNMVQVTTTGHEFCSNNPSICDYENDSYSIGASRHVAQESPV